MSIKARYDEHEVGWSAPELPVAVYRPVTGRMRIRMPYAPDNRRWLKQELGNIRPDWGDSDGQYCHKAWEVARAHLRDMVEALADRFGELDVLLDFSATERCDDRCINAVSDECVCACGGENHGGVADLTKDWVPVGDTTLVSTRVKRRRFRVHGSTH